MTNEYALLKDRATMLAQARAFFAKRNVLEIDCLALNPYPAIDANIDAIPAEVFPSQISYLHTSPEYAMKKLLSQGIGDIFYLGHVFRQGEIGKLHSPEFTMAEWYRIGFSLQQMMEETCAFIQLFLPNVQNVRMLSYRKAFEEIAHVNYSKDPLSKLQKAAQLAGFNPDLTWTRETMIHFLLTHVIEPSLGKEELTILTDYPPNEAALACVIEKEGELIAERFEIYCQGVELCNGYHELADAAVLRERFHEENRARGQAGKACYALDETFLSSLGPHFPDCCGVSVGIDRLLYLRHQATSLRDILPTSSFEKNDYT